MKKSAAATILLLAGAVQAGEATYVSDGEPLSELCVAALESTATLYARAAELHLDRKDVRELLCNGAPLFRFVRAARSGGADAPAAYAVTPADSSLETEICVAAVEDPVRFEELKAEHFEAGVEVEEIVLCNQRPLKSFVRRYGGGGLNTASL